MRRDFGQNPVHNYKSLILVSEIYRTAKAVAVDGKQNFYGKRIPNRLLYLCLTRIDSMHASVSIASNPVSLTFDISQKFILVSGDTGVEVVELQKLLLHWSAFSGYTSDVGDSLLHGHFDGVVRAAVEQFQAAMFLQPDGVVGKATWQALCTGAPVHMPVLSLGSQGIEVKRLQNVLTAVLNLSTAFVKGDFEADTEQAVRQFQYRFGLTVHGIVDAETWYALSRALIAVA